MPVAYIALGANLGDPPRQLRTALQQLAQLPQTRLLVASNLYRSAPLGPSAQAYYCNAVCSVDTRLAPAALLALMLELERTAGRVRSAERWGPRTLDLDLIHVEGVTSDAAALRLPHPELSRRNFVLVPLAEIAPTLKIPGLGNVELAAHRIGSDGLAPWPE